MTAPEAPSSGRTRDSGRRVSRSGDQAPLAPLALEPLVAQTEGLQPWRRVFHACSGLVLVGILVLTPISALWLAAMLAVGAGGALALDLVRLRSPRVNHLFFRVLRPFASPREAAGIASSTWYLIGVGMALACFPDHVAIAAILVLSLADPTASYLGRRWGRRSLGTGTGTVEGTVAFIGVAAAILVPLAGWGPGLVTAGLVAIIEQIRWPLDDNLTIPLATGALLWSLLPLG